MRLTRAARSPTPGPAGARTLDPALGLLVVCTGALVGPLDTAVNVAFPAITTAFGLALRDIQWMVVSFVVAQSILSLVFGRLGDLYGHRRIFAIGMTACVITHLAAGFAPDYGWLVAIRVLQGAAVALAVACAPALATLLFAPEDKRRILAIYVTAFSFGLAIGPLVGGALIDWLGWPGVFWFRAPLALIVLAMLPWLADARAPLSAPVGASAEAAAAVGAPASATPGESMHRSFDARPLVAARTEAVAQGLDAVRTSPFAATQLASVAINFACFAILLLVPFALSGWPGQSTTASGMLLALFPTGSLVGSLLSARFARRLTSASMITNGLLLASAGLVLTAAALPLLSALALGCTLVATGIGFGLFQVGYVDATTSMLPPEHRGVAGSLVAVTRLLGIVLGVTGISALHERLGSFETTIAAMGIGLLAFSVIALFIQRR